MNPPEIVGGDGWEDADVALEQWREEKRKRELERWRNYLAN